MDKIGGAFESITGTGENTNRVQSQSQQQQQQRQGQQTSPSSNESGILGSLGDKLSSVIGATGGNTKVERVCYVMLFYLCIVCYQSALLCVVYLKR